MKSLIDLCLVSVCLVFLSTTTTSAETCLTNRGLAFAAEADLKPYRPCNRLGGTYLLGLGIYDMQFSELPGVVPGELDYYTLVRAYLGATSQKDSTDIDRYYLLVGALAVLENDWSPRYRYYVTYILLEYWKLNKANISLSKHAMAEVINTFTIGEPLESVADVRCFIKADLPEFSIEVIMKTPRFLECQKDSIE